MAGDLEYVRNYYGVPVRRGVRVIADGSPGVITSGRGQYLRVRLDGDKHPGIWHPVWHMIYILADGSRYDPEAVRATVTAG